MTGKLLYKIKMLLLPSFVFFFLGLVILLFSCSKEKDLELKNMSYVPPGKFIIGSNEMDTNSLGKEFGLREKKLFENERPARSIHLDSFYIDKFEVTIKDYRLFIVKTGQPPPDNWENPEYLEKRKMHPVSAVSWFDASEYCKWAGKRLPTEEEWEKAARGPNGNKYPWGNDYDDKKANLDMGDTVPGGSMPEDKSFYGVYDMAGNLTEWTSSWYKAYPGSPMESKYFGETYKVVRGGAGSLEGHYNLGSINSRSSFREYYPPGGKGIDVGFRCAKDD